MNGRHRRDAEPQPWISEATADRCLATLQWVGCLVAVAMMVAVVIGTTP